MERPQSPPAVRLRNLSSYASLPSPKKRQTRRVLTQPPPPQKLPTDFWVPASAEIARRVGAQSSQTSAAKARLIEEHPYMSRDGFYGKEVLCQHHGDFVPFADSDVDHFHPKTITLDRIDQLEDLTPHQASIDEIKDRFPHITDPRIRLKIAALNDPSNHSLACKTCNTHKSDRNPLDVFERNRLYGARFRPKIQNPDTTFLFDRTIDHQGLGDITRSHFHEHHKELAERQLKIHALKDLSTMRSTQLNIQEYTDPTPADINRHRRAFNRRMIFAKAAIEPMDGMSQEPWIDLQTEQKNLALEEEKLKKVIPECEAICKEYKEAVQNHFAGYSNTEKAALKRKYTRLTTELKRRTRLTREATESLNATTERAKQLYYDDDRLSITSTGSIPEEIKEALAQKSALQAREYFYQQYEAEKNAFRKKPS